MSRSHCLLATSLGLVACLAASLAGCGDDGNCGSAGSSEFGLVVSSDQVSLAYGDLVAGANNDCPAADAPSGVVSLTVTGAEMTTTTTAGLITLCIPRPDQLGSDGALGSAVKIIDLTAMDATCSYTYDATHLPTGTVHGLGVCGNGIDPAGFGLVFDGYIGLRRTCAGTTDSVSVGITGNVAVKPS